MRSRPRTRARLSGFVTLSTLAVTALFAPGAAQAVSTTLGQERRRPPVASPLVIGHRGAPGYRPEHTLASYQLAIDLGADVIEPDLVSTADHVLVARHENEISGTTDVAEHPEFASRKRTKVVNGASLTGWFTEDFTLAELRRLRAKERIPALRPHNTLYDGRYPVPTFQEVIDLAVRESRRRHRPVWIYPETKRPTYFRSIGLPLEEPLVATLRRNGLAHRGAPVFVQSFEVGNLKRLNRMIDVPLVQLIDSTGAPYDFVASGDPRTYSDLATPAGLAGIARYADGIGPAKDRIVPRDAVGRLRAPTRLVGQAHAAGLFVHPFTFRNENAFLPADFRRGTNPAGYGNAFAEYLLFFQLGVDGLFSDNADTAVAARREFRSLEDRGARSTP